MQFSRRQGPIRIEESQMSQSRMSGPWKHRCREHRRPWVSTERDPGKRRRYRCVTCGQTFSSTKGTPYYRLQHRRARFDAVVALRVDGVSLSAIARVEGIAWNTVARWLEHAADGCRDFNQSRMAGFVVEELQADEIRSFVGGKTRPTWIFVAIEVWSRLWPSTVTGKRSYRNTLLERFS